MHQREKACLYSRVVTRLLEADLIGGKRYLLLNQNIPHTTGLVWLSFLCTRKLNQNISMLISADSLCVADLQTLLEEKTSLKRNQLILHAG